MSYDRAAIERILQAPVSKPLEEMDCIHALRGCLAEIDRLTRSAQGWEADAVNYARSRECQQERAERAEALAGRGWGEP